MMKNYNLLETIHGLDIVKPVKAGIFTSTTEIELFNYLITDNNYFKKYAEVKKDQNVSRYYFRRVKGYITSQL